MGTASAVILALVFLTSVLVDKAIHSVPAQELRRRARGQKDKRAAAIYKLAAFGNSSELFLRIVSIFSAAGLFLLALNHSWWTGILVSLLAMWLIWARSTKALSNSWRFSLAALAAPVYTALVGFLQPILSRVSSWGRRPSPAQPTGIYDKEDLLELLKNQARQPDSRISPKELKIARGSLALSDKTVGEAMLPWRKIKWVAAGDSIGPMVMDELHQTGQTRFPVVKEITKAANPQIVGALYLTDLLNNLENKGRVRDIMHQGANFINETQNLLSAIDGFLKSGHYLLVVINNFEEVVGVITLEDVLKQIFGDELSGDLDNYADMRSVASMPNPQTNSQPTKN